MEKILEAFVDSSRKILKDNLTGVYLHGSAVMGCFYPAKSDLDLIVVIYDKMTDEEKRTFMDMTVKLNALAPSKGIEVSIVKKDVCNPFIYPTPYELHFSITHLAWYKANPSDYVQKMNGTDKDLAAHFTVIRRRGKCIFGLPIHEVFSEVPKSDYMDSIWYDIANAREEIKENTMYFVLNLARVLAFQREGAVLSKKEGGEWALKNLPGEYYVLVENALKEYTGKSECSYDMECAVKYAAYMLHEIGTEGK